MKSLTPFDIYAQPGYLIRRAHQVATAAFAAATEDLDLTAVQFSALVAIKGNPDIDATRISEMISFDRTTIGHVLERLEKKKLITRRDGIKDKRTKLVRLTLKGESVVQAVSPRAGAIAEAILKPFTPAERAALLKLLGKFELQPAASNVDKASSRKSARRG